MVLAAQDEVTTLPYFIPMRNMDVKIGGNEFDRLRRWYKQGKLSKSRGMKKEKFPQTSSPRMIAKLIRQGVLQNARFAAAVLVSGVKRGKKEDLHLLMRTDCAFPTLYQIRQQGRFTTPVAYATAHVAALFIKFFPRELSGVFAPEMLPVEMRRAIICWHTARIVSESLTKPQWSDDWAKTTKKSKKSLSPTLYSKSRASYKPRLLSTCIVKIFIQHRQLRASDGGAILLVRGG